MIRAGTGLIAIENTANMAGGTVTPLTLSRNLVPATELRLPIHLDGARIFNASTALDIPVAELTRGFDQRHVLPVQRTLRPRWLHARRQPRLHRPRPPRPQSPGRWNEAGWYSRRRGPHRPRRDAHRLHDDHANARFLAEAWPSSRRSKSTSTPSRPTSSSSPFAVPTPPPSSTSLRVVASSPEPPPTTRSASLPTTTSAVQPARRPLVSQRK